MDSNTKEIALFGKTFTFTNKQFSLLTLAIPLAFIALCLLLTVIFVSNTVSNINNIDATFKMANSESGEITLNSDNTFTMPDNNLSGKWTINNGKITFMPNGKESFEGEYIDQKYIVIKDDNFFYGDISKHEVFDATLTDSKGNMYEFKSDKNFYQVKDTRSTLIGSYIVDDNFIVVTKGSETLTFIKCQGGMTNVYYYVV